MPTTARSYYVGYSRKTKLTQKEASENGQFLSEILKAIKEFKTS